MLFLITSVGACTLYIDALIIELCKICQAQAPGGGTFSKVFFDVSMVRWVVSVAWGPSE